jgi:transcriptional/translational regulatory protein YebC/TACO1
VGEIKTALTKNGGKMVAEGAVSFMFKQVGYIEMEMGDRNREELELKAIEAGADDVVFEDGVFSVYTKVEDLKAVKETLEKEGITIENAGITLIPNQKVEIGDEDREKYEKLLETLDNLDDVQEIYDNL